MKKLISFILFFITSHYSFASLDQEKVLCVKVLMRAFFADKKMLSNIQEKSIILGDQIKKWSECEKVESSALFPESIGCIMSKDEEGVKFFIYRYSCKQFSKDWFYADSVTGEIYHIKRSGNLFGISMFIPGEHIDINRIASGDYFK